MNKLYVIEVGRNCRRQGCNCGLTYWKPLTAKYGMTMFLTFDEAANKVEAIKMSHYLRHSLRINNYTAVLSPAS